MLCTPSRECYAVPETVRSIGFGGTVDRGRERAQLRLCERLAGMNEARCRVNGWLRREAEMKTRLSDDWLV